MAKRIIKDYEAEVKHITDWIQDFFAQNGTMNTPAVIGISGGKDSTVVAYLCAAALGKERVIGVKMPCHAQHDIDCADKVIGLLGIDDYQINIGDMVDATHTELKRAGMDSDKPWIKNNIPPRIRMTVLYAVAAANGGFVANTSNLSERTVGWSTKWGDSVGDFAPLADYTVEEIMGIGEVLGIPEDLLYKDPEDGLTNKSDEENLGVSYEQIDEYIRSNENPQPYEAFKRIVDYEKANKHKRINLPHPYAQVLWDDDRHEVEYF